MSGVVVWPGSRAGGASRAACGAAPSPLKPWSFVNLGLQMVAIGIVVAFIIRRRDEINEQLNRVNTAQRIELDGDPARQDLDHELAEEFFRAVASAARVTLHVDIQAGAIASVALGLVNVLT